MIFKLLLLFLIFYIDGYSQSEELLEDASVSGIREEENFVWVATQGQGIYRFSKKDNKWYNFSTNNENLDNDLFYNIAVSRDYIWAGATDGLYTYDKRRNKWHKRKFAQGGEFGNWIRALEYDQKENVIWIGRFRNLTRLDVARQRFTDFDLTKGNDPKTNNFKAIEIDGDSLIWFGTEGGVHIFNKKIEDGNPWTFISNKKGFNQEGDAVSISDFLFERENVWIGTDEFITSQMPGFNVGGVYRFNRKLRWDRISKQDGLPANGIFCFERTGNKIWASVYSFDKKGKKEYGKGLALIDRLTGEIVPVDLNNTEINSATILCMHFDGSSMWIGTDNGLYRILIANQLAEWPLKIEEPVLKPKSKLKTRR
jgi:ligand-binding sensor domain-containing protein